MKITDALFALICGRVIGFLVYDFFVEWNIHLGLYYQLLIWVALPFATLFCLWISYGISKWVPFIYQAAKHVLVGAFATVVDLWFFQAALWGLAMVGAAGIIAPKSLSFLLATSIKYWGNKYWAFGKHEAEDIKKEVLHFFLITLAGLLIDLGAFYYFIAIMGPQFGLSAEIWLKLSVLLAGLVAALFNFLGYKFLVFKK